MVWPARLKDSLAPLTALAGAAAAVLVDGGAAIALLVFALAVGAFALVSARRERDAAVATARTATARDRASSVVAETAGALLAGTSPAEAVNPQVEQALAQVGARLEMCHAPCPRASETALPVKASGASGWLYVDRDGPLTREEADSLLARITGAIATAAERVRREANAADAEAARQAELAKTSVMHAVAHDLRTPLAALVPATEALERDGLATEDRARLVETVAAEAARLQRMVDDLLDLSRIAAGAVNPQPEWCDLGEIVGTAVERVAESCPVRASLPTDLPRVHADRAQLERVFENLIENATKFSPPERPAEIRGICANGRVTIRVLDHGRGIPPAQQSHVFKPFVRGSSTHSGAGLGLAICRGFVEANGGRIALQSGARDGSAFTVSFPVAAEPSRVG